MKNEITKEQIIEKIENSYQSFYYFINQLDQTLLLEYKNPNGWNVRDFIVHLARWEMGIVYLLQQKPRGEGMGIPKELVDNWDLETINQSIRQKSQEITVQESIIELDNAHRAMIETLEKMDDTDLMKPYRYYDQNVDFTEPVINWIRGNTFDHFDEHRKILQKLFESN